MHPHISPATTTTVLALVVMFYYLSGRLLLAGLCGASAEKEEPLAAGHGKQVCLLWATRAISTWCFGPGRVVCHHQIVDFQQNTASSVQIY